MKVSAFITTAAFVALVNVAGAQTKPGAPAPSPGKPAPAAPATGMKLPSDYVIGIGDVLTVTYRDEKEMTGDHLVRPDGKITIPLGIGDLEVVGATTEQVTERLVKASTMFVKPTITVGIKAINSRKVSITGSVEKPGQYDILGPMDVVQLISLAGGLREYTNGKEIRIIRTENGTTQSFLFNYKEVLDGKNLKQNIPLKPGDSVLVPE